MQRNRGNVLLAMLLILGGGLGLAVNLGYFAFQVEMVAAAPFLLGLLLLVNAFGGDRDQLFPALLFIFLSLPLYLTLAGYGGERFWPFWVLAPGLAFLATSLQGGSYRAMAIPGTIVTLVGLVFLGQEWWQIDSQVMISVGLMLVGALLLILNRRGPTASR